MPRGDCPWHHKACGCVRPCGWLPLRRVHKEGRKTMTRVRDAIRTSVMTDFPSVGTGYRVEFRMHGSGGGEFLGEFGVAVVVLRVSDGGGNPTYLTVMDMIADKAVDAWNATLKLYQSTAVKLGDVQVIGIQNPNDIGSRGVDTTGTNVLTPVPKQAAAVISWGTGQRGRRFRNRCYVPGISIGAQDAGVLDEPAAQACNDFMTGMNSIAGTVASFNPPHERKTIGTALAVWSRPQSESVGQQVNRATGWAVRAVMGSQRRRVRAT